MFHSNAPSSFGASITRTQGRSVIHNDENAMAMPLLSSKNMIMHMNMNTNMNLHLHLRNKSKSGTRSGALRTHNSNSNAKINANSNVNNNVNSNVNVNANSNSKPSFANMNAKTPLKNRNSTNTRRRALGDISNRKGTANGNANGNGNGFGGIHMNIHADAKSNTCSENSKETHVHHVPVSIYTPHKRSETKRSSDININTNGLKQNTSMNTFPSSTTHTRTHTRTRTGKRKHISFAIHTSSELTPNDHTCGSRATRTRTRTPPEREILGNNTNRGCFSIDVDEGLDAIRAIHEQDRYNAMNNLKHHIMSEDELGHHAVQEALSHLEHVDDDVLQSHLMFDEYNDLFGGSLDDNEDEDDLIANSDDISI